MRLPRDLSGQELVAALCRRWGSSKVNQVGSHIILETKEPAQHCVAVPTHKTPRIGTLIGFFEPLLITKASTGKISSVP